LGLPFQNETWLLLGTPKVASGKIDLKKLALPAGVPLSPLTTFVVLVILIMLPKVTAFESTRRNQKSQFSERSLSNILLKNPPSVNRKLNHQEKSSSTHSGEMSPNVKNVPEKNPTKPLLRRSVNRMLCDGFATSNQHPIFFLAISNKKNCDEAPRRTAL
jgi:uncharacterized Zn-finger protein